MIKVFNKFYINLLEKAKNNPHAGLITINSQVYNIIIKKAKEYLINEILMNINIRILAYI